MCTVKCVEYIGECSLVHALGKGISYSKAQ